MTVCSPDKDVWFFKVGAFHNISACPVIIHRCTVLLFSMQYPFFLWDNTFCLTLSVDYSPRVPPETERVRIVKNDSEQPAGTVHEMQQ